MKVETFAPQAAHAPTGGPILDAIYGFLGRFVAYPSEAAHVAHVLWIAHTHVMERWDSTPRIAFLSPEPKSGKSRCLEVTELLVPNPVQAVNVTPAYLFRKVASEEGRPTILFDEIDTIFGPRAKDNEEIRGVLNAGHRKGAVAGRCVVRGKLIETEEIPAYCAVALAGLGDLPDTILTRSVAIRMKRRAPDERVEPFRRRQHHPEGDAIRQRLADWAKSIAEIEQWPDIPPSITDRDADVWEALLAVADAAGRGWPERARVSAVSLVSASKVATPSLGIRLLADVRRAFGDRDAVPTDTLLTALHKMDDAPWGNLKDKPIDDRYLAARLKKYEVRPTQIRIGAWTGKGYRRADLHDAWQRYLGVAAYGCETSETSETLGP